MKSADQGARKSAGRIGAIVLKSLLVVLVMALPISAEAPGVWTLSANLNTARANHAAAMLPNGQALIVGGTGVSGTLTSAEVYSLADGTFTEVPTGLNTAVSGLTATVLNDNTVLLAGGLNGSGAPVATAELYNPSLGAFVTLPAMNTARSHHTATLLSNGTVLIAGGSNSAGPLASLEIFDPASRTFTATSTLEHARRDHTATLLTDGTVLIAGGSNSSGPLASAEIYNPATNKVTETGSLNTARTLASASMLLDFNGDVLIEGGRDANGNDLNTAEEFSTATGAFTTLTAQMITARSGHLGLTLPYNGKVLIAGGTSAGAPVAANELYDPIAQAFVANDPMSTARDEFAANFFAVPAVGQVLMSGGLDSLGTPLALTEMFSYPTIRTDKSDYPPGSPVIIYGTGFTPGETVATVIEGSNNENDEKIDIADSTGSFTDTSFSIADTDGGVVFVMTATGQTSGLTAQDRFTDSVTVNGVTITPSSDTVTAPATASYTVNCTGSGSGTETVTYSVLSGLPSGATASFSSNPTTGCGTGHSTTLTITTTCASVTPTTGTIFTVQGQGNSGSPATKTATLVVKGPQLQIKPYTGINFGYSIFLDSGTPTAPPRIVTVCNGEFTAGTPGTCVPNPATCAGALTITSVVPSPSQFAKVSDSCTGATLTATETCTVGLHFTATAVGKVSGALKFTSNASNSPHTIALVGEGVAGLIRVSAAITFPNTVVGTTSATTNVATLSNPNAVALDVYDVYVASRDFSIQNDTCSGTTHRPKGSIVSPDSCTVGVTFTPTQQGLRTGTVTVDSIAKNSGATIALKGTGTLSAPTFSPKPLAFGKVSVGSPETLPLTVTNPNSVALDFGTASISGGVYTIASDACSGNSIGAAASCTISVTFTPTAKPAVSGTLSIVDNAGAVVTPGTTQKVALTGSGT